MRKIPNSEKVSVIVMHPTACLLCQIGQDWYHCEFEVVFEAGESYPDYIEVQNYIMQEIDGKELNIETATRKLYDHLKEYDPKSLSITCYVEGCKSHFDVEVTID